MVQTNPDSGFSLLFKTIKTVSIQIKEIISTKIEEPISIKIVEVTSTKDKFTNPQTIKTPAYQSSSSTIAGLGLLIQMDNLTEMLSKFITSNTASSLNSCTLPSQTVTNPREHVNAITTQSGKTCEGPLTPLVPSPAKKTVQEPNSPEPNSYQPKLPYPERMKVREKDKPSAQQSRFMKLFKQLRLEIGLKDALIEMPKFNKWLSTLLRNKEKLEEITLHKQ
ncbi:hypothetical protein Tco_0315910 [Tanacetum coccineum]